MENLDECSHLQVKQVLEGLFGHFFGKHRRHFHPVDVEWFLKTSNCEHQWRAKIPVEENIPDVAPTTKDTVCKISRGVLKFYLQQILASPQLSTCPMQPVLNLQDFNIEVWLYPHH